VTVNEPTADVDRIPLTRSVHYAVRGMPEVPNQYGPGVLAPSEITLTYREASDSQLGRVHAYVAGRIWADGKELPLLPGGLYGQHYFDGLDGWPEWLAEEARLHDPAPAAPAGPAPATDRAALRQRIAAALRPHASFGGAPSRWQMPFFDGATPSLPRISGWKDVDDVADAVLAVLPAPDQQTAARTEALREAIDMAETLAANMLDVNADRGNGAYDVVDLLRRLAGETQQDGCGPAGSEQHTYGDHCEAQQDPTQDGTGVRCTCQYIAEPWIQMDHAPDCPARPGQPETEARCPEAVWTPTPHPPHTWNQSPTHPQRPCPGVPEKPGQPDTD
jgi:hypothetical protein